MRPLATRRNDDPMQPCLQIRISSVLCERFAGYAMHQVTRFCPYGGVRGKKSEYKCTSPARLRATAAAVLQDISNNIAAAKQSC